MKAHKATAKHLQAGTIAITLLYYEGFEFVNDVIRREKEVKKWSRIKKESLIDTLNPVRLFFNDDDFFDHKGKVDDLLSSG